MAWWREARFGMFIHWGLYAVPAGEWKGERTGSVGEWIMFHKQIPAAEYEPLARQFNPVKFDAARWVSIARNAGMKYIIVTSKHHDGFCLFDSELTEYDIVDATPFGRDVLAELAAECGRQGVRLGFYYSIMDWHHRDYLPRRPWDARPAADADFERYVQYMKGQLRELVTKYDPAVLWFDGGMGGDLDARAPSPATAVDETSRASSGDSPPAGVKSFGLEQVGETITIRLPDGPDDPIASVIAVDLDGPPNTDNRLVIRQRDDGSLLLPARLAEVHGHTARYESGDGKDNIGFWTCANDWLSWPLQVEQGGEFDVRLTQATDAGTGGSEFAVEAAGSRLTATIRESGSWTAFETVDLGRLRIPAGEHALSVRVLSKPGLAVMNLKQLELRRVRE